MITPKVEYKTTSRGILCVLLANALLTHVAVSDEFSSTSLGIDGPPTLAVASPGASNANALAEIDPSTGAVRASLRFELPVARGRAQPSLALVYNSGLGLGSAGVGWSLNLPSIERKGATGFPKFVDDPEGNGNPSSMCSPDVFPLPQTGPSCADRFLLAGQPLVPICVVSASSACGSGVQGESFPDAVGGWTYFRTEIDNGDRVFWSPDRQTWMVQSRSGVTSYFGRPLDLIPAGHGLEIADALFRIADPMSPVPTNLPKDVSAIYRWNLVRMVDLAGNTVVFQWSTLAADSKSGVDGIQFLTDIFDTSLSPDGNPRGALFTVLSEYAHHTHLRWSAPDDSTSIITQSPVWRGQSPLRLLEVDITSKPATGSPPNGPFARELVRRYHLTYIWNSSHTLPFLASLQLEGRCPAAIQEDPQGTLPPTMCDRQPPTTLEYTAPPFAAKVTAGVFQLSQLPTGPIAIKDIDGDALPELLYLAGDVPNQTIAVAQRTISTSTTLNQAGSKRVAQIQDIAPAAAHAVFGDFLRDGRIDVAFVNPGDQNPGPPQQPSLELYALDPISDKWIGQGPSGLPPYFPTTPWKPDPTVFAGAGRLVNIDIDGDGLTDILLPDPAVTKFGGWRAYLTALDLQGAVHPFAERPAPTCIPHVAGALLRSIADFDGDGLLDFIEFEDITGPGPSTFPAWRIRAWKSRGDGRFGLGDVLALDNCKQRAGHEVITGFDIPARDRGALVDKTVALHDINGDGFADLVIATEDGLDVFTHARSDSGIDTFQEQFHSQFLHISSKDPNLRSCWPVSTDPGATFDPKRIALLFADVNATGIDDLIVVNGHGANCVVSFTDGQRPGMLSSISNGYGVSTHVEYDTVANLDQAAKSAHKDWHTKLPIPAWVVTRVTTVNGLQPPLAESYEVKYAYVDPVYDRRDRTFAGFHEVTVTQTGDSTAPGSRTHTTLLTTTCPPDAATGVCQPSADYVYRVGRGLPGIVEVMTTDESANTHLLTTTYTYLVTPLYVGRDFRVVRRASHDATDTYSWDPAKQDSHAANVVLLPSSIGEPLKYGTIPILLPVSTKHVLGTANFDQFGNLLSAVDWGEIDKDGFTPIGKPIVANFVWNRPSGENTGWTFRPTSQSVGYGDKRGQLVTASRSFSYVWNPLGLPSEVSAKLSGTAPLDRHHDAGGAVAPPPTDASVDGVVKLATVTYDNFGNVLRSQLPNGRCADIGYDLTYHQLPVAKIAFRHACNSSDPFITELQYDRGLEVLLRTTGPDGRVSGFQYDSFGRLAEVDQPDSVKLGQVSPFPAVTIDYSLADTGPVRKVRTRRIFGLGANPEYAESWTYLDGFGRPLASVEQSEISDRWIVSGMTQRTANGRVARVFEPQIFAGIDGSSFPLNLPARSAQYTYDELGQLLTATTLDGRTTTLQHRPLEFAVDVFDPEQVTGGAHAGSFATLKKDAQGRTASIEEHLAKDPVDTITTSFAYEATGELLSRTQTHSANPNEAVVHQAFYDTLGRRVRSLEPNSSVGNPPALRGWAYAYNDNGDLVGTSDARGCGQNFFYDRLGRLLAADYSPCIGGQDPYSPPDSNTGAGVELLNVYDVPLKPTGSSSDNVYRGRLVATFDRAQRSDVVLDARGRTSVLRRQLAIPGAGSQAFATRYAPRIYQKLVLESDEANRPTGVTTGAETPELNLPNIGSWIKTVYTPRGTISSITSSYGDLIASQQFDAFGALRARVFGDAARTTLNATYDDGGLLKGLGIMRLPGPWLPESTIYKPPAAGEPNTLQGVLTLKRFEYDGAQNPKSILDFASDDWPAGAASVASKFLSYDDAYHLRKVETQYAASPEAPKGDDLFTSPLAAEQERNDLTFPVIIGAMNRMRLEQFNYDWTGNITLADDDKHLFDRSPGSITVAAEHPHQIASATQGGVKASPSYDDAGNVTKVEIVRDKPCSERCPARYEYVWDEVGLLLSARRFDAVGSDVRLAVTIGYTHSWNGVRVLRQVESPGQSPVTTADVFDTLQLERAQFSQAQGDYERTPATERVNLVTAAGVLGQVRFVSPDVPSGSGGRTRVFLTLDDQLGSTSFVIDRETSELVERVSYEAFGTTEADYRPQRWGSYRDGNHYTGHLDEVEVGLVDFGARMYIPTLGRWASPDPLAVHTLSGDVNAYAFVHGSPMRFVDPVGLDTYGCDNMSPGCGGGFNEGFPGDSGFVSGPAAGGGGGGNARPLPSRGSSPSTVPKPIDPGVPVTGAGAPTTDTNFLSEFGSLAHAETDARLQKDLITLLSLVEYALGEPNSTSLEPTDAAYAARGGQAAMSDIDQLLSIGENEVGGAVAGAVLGAGVRAMTAEASVAAKMGRGFINPSEVRFTQDSIGALFKNGQSINDVARALGGPGGSEFGASFPPIRLVEKDGLLWTLDNRRLVAFSTGGQPVPYRMATEAEIAAEWTKKFTTTLDQGWGQFITVRPIPGFKP